MKILRTDVAGFILLGTAVMNCAAPAAGLELEQKGQAVQATPAVELEQKGPAITPAPPEPVIAKVKLKNGTELSGLITGYENNALILFVNEQPAKIPLTDIANMTFRRPPPPPKGFKVEGEIFIPGLTGYANLKAGDWDGDGKPELYTVNGGKLQVISLKGSVLAERQVGAAGINLLADVDKDKKDEVFISWAEGTDLIIAALGKDLKELKRFKLQGGMHNGRPDSGASAAAVVDLDKDGKQELLATANSGYGWKPRGIYCLDWETGRLLWRYNIGPSAGAPIAADISGDGKLEVVFGSYSPGNGNSEEDGTDDGHCYVFALSHKGEKLWISRLGSHFTGANPMLEDLDGDGKKELFARMEAGPDFRREVGLLLKLGKDGEELARFDAGSTLYGCEAADIDGDKKKELVCADRKGMVYALDGNLKVLRKTGLGAETEDSPTPRLAGARDLDGDGKPEVFLTYSEQKFVSGRNPRSDGGPRNVRHYYNNSVLVLDGALDVRARYIAAGEWKEHPGFSVLAADTDGDKKPELVSLSDKAVVLKLLK